MTVCCLRVREACDCALGVNVLRNDVAAALGIALACEAAFVRVNVDVGAMLTDQGLIRGARGRDTALAATLGAEQVRIFADVLVKHAVPLGPLAWRRRSATPACGARTGRRGDRQWRCHRSAG